MEQIYNMKMEKLGYSQLVCDIFLNWEDVKDEILLPERKAGSGNGTVHIFLGAADADLRKEFSSYYDKVANGQDTAIGAVKVKHYFLASNVLSVLGYVCQYYKLKGEDFSNLIGNILTQLQLFQQRDGLLSTYSLFKLSIGSNKLRPYFKQFDDKGVFHKIIRQLLLPNSAYKISLYKNVNKEYAAFWLIGFSGFTDFESDANEFYVTNTQLNIPFKSLSLQRIFYGAPGTGKSHTIKEVVKGEDVIRTTFHPDSDYSTFVGCYKPTTKIVRMRDMAGHVIMENNEEVTEDRIVYEFVSQAFLQAYVAAWKKLGEAQGGEAKRQFLVIEEINRGNCAQVFGDLFQLLDRNDYGFSEYSIKADADIKKYLQKAFAGLEIANKERIDRLYDKRVVNQVVNGDILLLPNNLYVWATMNTSDQSLFPIDSAFKRRWDWQYVPICNAGKDWIIEVGENQYGWWQFLEKINALIGTTTNSEDKKLGYFFCKAKAGIISAEIFVSKVIFYLWNDVFKNYELSDAFFKDADNSILTFDKFYGIDESGKTIVQEDKVKMFLANLKVDIISKSANEEVNGEMTESEA